MNRGDELVLQLAAEVVGGLVALSALVFLAKLMIDQARTQGVLSEQLAHTLAENAAIKRANAELNKPADVNSTVDSLEKGTF